MLNYFICQNSYRHSQNKNHIFQSTMAVVRCCRIIKKTLNTTTHPFIEHNYSRCSRFLALRRQSSTAPSVTVQSYIHATDDKALNDIQNSFSIIPDFISEDEETVLYEEVQRYLKKLRYEFDHWDNVSIY